jgi:sulfane dehydrogenase subunit SoxC
MLESFCQGSEILESNVQPDRQSLIAATGTNALFHYNAQQTWSIDEAGRVRNALS